MYVEHSPTIPEYSWNATNTYGMEESSSIAHSEFETHIEAHLI